MEHNGYTNPSLDRVFSALADPTRRAILAQLLEGKASAGELAHPFAISQPAVSRHLKVLEQAGLIERQVDEQRRLAKLAAQPLAPAVAWLTQFKAFWEQGFDELDSLLAEMQHPDPKPSKDKPRYRLRPDTHQESTNE